MNLDGRDFTGLRVFDPDEIFRHLLGLSAPVMESSLLKALTGEERTPREHEELFRLHFSLYHALHILKESAGRKGYYLHLDPMRTRLIEIPRGRICTVYFPESGTICGSVAARGNFCSRHLKEYRASYRKLSFDPLHEFYLNPENISYASDELIKKLASGAVLYALRKGEIEKARKFFGLTSPSRKSIKKRYRELALQFHPDVMKGDDSMMKELNVSYKILMEVYLL